MGLIKRILKVGSEFKLRPINFKGGLTRIWIVLSVVYVILALFVLAKNSDCVGYTARLAKAQSIESANNPKISRLMDKLPKEPLNEFDISIEDRFRKSLGLGPSFNEKLDQMREVYPRFASEILDLKAEIRKYNYKVGRCPEIFIWRFDNKRYANIGTMLGTTLGGLILFWGSLYILFGVGWVLPYIWIGIGRGLSWIKDGFTGGSSNESNELETRIDDEEGK